MPIQPVHGKLFSGCLTSRISTFRPESGNFGALTVSSYLDTLEDRVLASGMKKRAC